jgi:hypothetical protein
MAEYSTVQVARMIGVHKLTLLRWLYAHRLPEPRHSKKGGQDVRIWSDQDLARAQKFKGLNYCKGKGRGRKKKPKMQH